MKAARRKKEWEGKRVAALPFCKRAVCMPKEESERKGGGAEFGMGNPKSSIPYSCVNDKILYWVAHTGNGIVGRTGCTGQCKNYSISSVTLCDPTQKRHVYTIMKSHHFWGLSHIIKRVYFGVEHFYSVVPPSLYPGLCGVKGEISISQSGKPMSFEEEEEKEREAKAALRRIRKGLRRPSEGGEELRKANFRIN